MSSKLVIGTLLGAIALVAAAGGGYVMAGRQAVASPVPSRVAATESTPAAVPEPAAAPARVTESATLDRRTEEPERHGLAAPPERPLAAKPAEPVTARPVASPPPAATVDIPPTDTRDASVDPAPQPEPLVARLSELTVSSDSVIGIRLESTLSSDTARVEDRVSARVTRDVVVDGRTAISAGSRLEGVVNVVERAGKFRDRSRVGVRFQSILLADGMRVPIETATIFRDGESPAGQATQTVGASAAIGGILGAVLGGKKGAAIGSSVGAAGGAAAVMAGSAPPVILQAGTPLTVRLTSPITVTVERD